MLIQINTNWQSLNALSGVAVGSAMIVQSQSASRVYVKQQATQPESGSVDAAILQHLSVWKVTSGSAETWVKADATTGQLFAEVV